MAKLTEKAILQTFDDMIHEMPFEKITVSALVARCGIKPPIHFIIIIRISMRW